MPAKFYLLTAAALFLLGPAPATSQPPRSGEKALPQVPKPPKPPEEEKEMLNQIKEAYKAPYEVPQDILKELRKAYQQPSPEREAKVFKEIRRLYLPTAAQEEAILREVRRAYQQPSAEQEQRILRAIERADPLPPGTVPPSVQTEQARKLFLKLDLNGDGTLSPDEMPEVLRGERAACDTNRDGFIDPDEYWAYYQGRLRGLSEQVASGQIDLGLKRGGPDASTVPPAEERLQPAVSRAGTLPPGVPAWFSQLDADADAQVGLYEWKKSGRPFQEFFALDRNNDGFITVTEVLRYLAQAKERSGTTPDSRSGGSGGGRSGSVVDFSRGGDSGMSSEKDKKGRTPGGR